MNNYNKEYFFIQINDEIENLPDLSPDKATEGRNYTYALVFKNGDREDFEEDGLLPLKNLPRVLFSGDDILVSTDIRRELIKLNVSDLSMHPAVYIHDDDEWYEEYWFCTFVKDLDCWDRNKSKVRKKSVTFFEGTPDETRLYSVAKYYLDNELFDQTPLEKRLLFKMGGTLEPYITCHESVKYLFETEGSRTIPVGEW